MSAAPPCVLIGVVDDALARALSVIVQGHGWKVARTTAIEELVVTRPGLSPTDVLLIDATPRACAVALRALVAGRVRAFLTSDHPEELGEVLAALGRGYGSVPLRALDMARSMPSLSPREHEIMAAILAGLSNAQIARRMRLSEATVKRDVALLIRKLGAPCRRDLLPLGRSLGLAPLGWVTP